VPTGEARPNTKEDPRLAITTREWLAKATLSKEMVDRFLDPETRNIWAFDAELGFGVRSCIRNDGVDGSKTVTHVDPSGERRMVNSADRPCRINTYGNSFNMSQQVSDGESWQEYLAAHFGEPIRNFGVGGYSVYQAYRRMLREEKTKSAAEHLVLHVYSEDHRRNIAKWRWVVGRYPDLGLEKTVFRRSETWGFFANPQAHLRLDPVTGGFAEFENPYPTHDSLYLLCDEEHVYETFKDDFEVQAFLAEQHVPDIRPQVLQTMAEALEMPADFGSPEAAAKTARSLVQECALRSSMYVLD
jgi:hypothetical protein